MPLRFVIVPVAVACAVAGGLVGYRLGRGARLPDRRIVVDAGLRDGLRADHQRRAGRPPTPDEERALIDRFVETEMLYREALARGLDRGDVIVRRRLVQKVELAAEDAAAAAPPSEAELSAELAASPSRYQRPARTALAHVFVSRDRHADVAAEAARLLDLLRAGAAAGALGDPFIRGAAVPLSTDAELQALFGAEFPARIAGLPAAQWSGPIPSSYGLHLVRIEAREPARAPSLDEARAEIARDLAEHRRAHAREALLAGLRARYEIQIAAPGAQGAAR